MQLSKRRAEITPSHEGRSIILRPMHPHMVPSRMVILLRSMDRHGRNMARRRKKHLKEKKRNQSITWIVYGNHANHLKWIGQRKLGWNAASLSLSISLCIVGAGSWKGSIKHQTQQLYRHHHDYPAPRHQQQYQQQHATATWNQAELLAELLLRALKPMASLQSKIFNQPMAEPQPVSHAPIWTHWPNLTDLFASCFR